MAALAFPCRTSLSTDSWLRVGHLIAQEEDCGEELPCLIQNAIRLGISESDGDLCGGAVTGPEDRGDGDQSLPAGVATKITAPP